jgi:DNA-nicking Smr family endonuclease
MPDKTIDLHGLREAEALRKLVRDYNSYVRSGGRDPVWIVHGYGSSGRGGGLRRAVRDYTAAHSRCFEKVLDGERLANPGITLVYPKRLLPEVKPGR